MCGAVGSVRGLLSCVGSRFNGVCVRFVTVCVHSFVDFGFVFVCFMWDGETCTDPKCVMCEMWDLGCVVSEVCGTRIKLRDLYTDPKR